jgi:hypothetical protein
MSVVCRASPRGLSASRLSALISRMRRDRTQSYIVCYVYVIDESDALSYTCRGDDSGGRRRHGTARQQQRGDVALPVCGRVCVARRDVSNRMAVAIIGCVELKEANVLLLPCARTERIEYWDVWELDSSKGQGRMTEIYL